MCSPRCAHVEYPEAISIGNTSSDPSTSDATGSSLVVMPMLCATGTTLSGCTLTINCAKTVLDDSFVASMRFKMPLLGSALFTTQSLPAFAFGIVMRLGALNNDLSEMPCCTAALSVYGFMDEPACRPLPPPPG